MKRPNVTRGRGAYSRTSRPLPMHVVDAIHASVSAQGWVKTYREAKVGETTIRNACDGLSCAPMTYERLSKFAEHWMMQHPEVRHEL